MPSEQCSEGLVSGSLAIDDLTLTSTGDTSKETKARASGALDSVLNSMISSWRGNQVSIHHYLLTRVPILLQNKQVLAVTLELGVQMLLPTALAPKSDIYVKTLCCLLYIGHLISYYPKWLGALGTRFVRRPAAAAPRLVYLIFTSRSS